MIALAAWLAAVAVAMAASHAWGQTLPMEKITTAPALVGPAPFGPAPGLSPAPDFFDMDGAQQVRAGGKLSGPDGQRGSTPRCSMPSVDGVQVPLGREDGRGHGRKPEVHEGAWSGTTCPQTLDAGTFQEKPASLSRAGWQRERPYESRHKAGVTAGRDRHSFNTHHHGSPECGQGVDPGARDGVTPGRMGEAVAREQVQRNLREVEQGTGSPRRPGHRQPAAFQSTIENRQSQIFRVTAYCPCTRCCGPAARGVTASGKPVTANGGRFVAADRSLPFGTMVRVPGYPAQAAGEWVPVLDRGGAIKGNRLDVFFQTHAQARAWGVRTLKVEVIR